MTKNILNAHTPFQLKRMERNKKICEEYKKLTANPEQSRMEVNSFLIKKYGLESPTSIYRILKKGGVK